MGKTKGDGTGDGAEKPDQSKWIARALAHLKKGLKDAGTPKAAEAISATQVGSAQYTKVFLHFEDLTAANDGNGKFKGKGGKLGELAASHPQMVRTPHSYKDDRVRQALRWLSTSLLKSFPKGIEFQCYLHGDTVYVSSNVDAVNKELLRQIKASVAQNRTLIEELKTLNRDDAGASDGARARQERHGQKMDAEMKRARDGDQLRHQGHGPVIAAILNGKVEVVGINDQGTYMSGKQKGEPKLVADHPDYKDGFHAERRIIDALNKKFANFDFDPMSLGGVKRPCGVCALALNLMGTRVPGPIWASAAATMNMLPEDFAEGLLSYFRKCSCADEIQKGLSALSQHRANDARHWENDSSSDSDDDGNDPGTRSDDESSDESESVLVQDATGIGERESDSQGDYGNSSSEEDDADAMARPEADNPAAVEPARWNKRKLTTDSADADDEGASDEGVSDDDWSDEDPPPAKRLPLRRHRKQ